MTDVVYHPAAPETEPAELELKIKVPYSERYHLQLALAAPDMFSDLSNFQQEFRKYQKYEEPNHDRVDQLYEELCALVAKYEDLVE